MIVYARGDFEKKFFFFCSSFLGRESSQKFESVAILLRKGFFVSSGLAKERRIIFFEKITLRVFFSFCRIV